MGDLHRGSIELGLHGAQVGPRAADRLDSECLSGAVAKTVTFHNGGIPSSHLWKRYLYITSHSKSERLRDEPLYN